MATYLTGVTDYIPTLQAFQPDYNFLANVLQTRQSRYDSNYKQLSSVYSSLFNSPMTRDDNNKTKDEFFKNIDQNIKKISGMDLSLQQNADIANKVFQPFLDNKALMKDITSTKQHMNGVSRHEQLKSCPDPDKCGGQAWEPGLQKLQYKLDEFKKMSAEDALNFQMPDYDSYNNWQKKAIEASDKLGYNVTQETVNGPFLVKTTNGQLVTGGLYSIYKQMYGNDPSVQENYKTKAYVNRKQNIDYAVSQGQTEESAERAYLNDQINNTGPRVTKMYNQFMGIKEKINEKVNVVKQQSKSGVLLPDEADELEALLNTKNGIDTTTKSLEITNNSIYNNSDNTDINTLRYRADNAAAAELEERDIEQLAVTMSGRGSSQTLNTNPYALAETTANLSLRNSKMMADINNQYKLGEMRTKHIYDLDLKYPGSMGGAGTQNTTPTIFFPGDATTHPNIDDKAVGFVANLDHRLKMGTDADNNNKTLILDMFSQAKQAATKGDDYSVNAIHILEDTFGKDWATIDINKPETLLKNMTERNQSSNVIMNKLLNSLDAKKNPATNVKWANNFMTNNAQRIQDAKKLNIANTVVNRNERDSWKEITKSIKDQYNVNPLYYNADLLISPTGDKVSQTEFKRKYDERYRGQGGDADKVYEVVNNKFLEEYNVKVPTWNHGAGTPIGGDNTTTGAAMRYSNVSVNRPMDPSFIRMNTLLSSITDPNQSGFITTVLGDDITGSPAPELNHIIENIITDNTNPTKQGVKPIITYDERTIAGNNADQSAVTIHVANAEEYFKQFWGTPKNPSPLDLYKTQLLSGEGITLSYNNKDIRTPTSDVINQYSALEEIIKGGGYVLDSWPKGGKIEFNYNPSNGMVTPTGTVVKYDDATGKSFNEQKDFPSFDISDSDNKEAFYADILNKAQYYSINIAEPFIRNREKTKLQQTPN